MRPLLVACLLAGLLMSELPRSVATSGLVAWHAYRQLGIVGGWHCLRDAVYRYDPRRERPDRALLADAPETAARAHLERPQAPTSPVGIVFDRVEASLRGGETSVWARLTFDGGIQERRVLVLASGSYKDVAADLPGGEVVLCQAAQRAWSVVGEHALPT